MVQEDPSERPTIDSAVSRLSSLMESLPSQVLRSRLVYVDETPFTKMIRNLGHSFRTIGHIIVRRPALPVP